MNSSLRAILFCGLLLMSGCASVRPGGCAGTDWYQQGYMDGLRTWYSRVEEHSARCAASGAAPDAKKYQKGWEDGVFDQAHRPRGV